MCLSLYPALRVHSDDLRSQSSVRFLLSHSVCVVHGVPGVNGNSFLNEREP